MPTDPSVDLPGRVTRHYDRAELLGRVLEALRSAGRDPEALTLDDLKGLDEFHLGGRRATLAVVEALGLRAGARVLDVGCGIGGPARAIAAQFDVHVTGVDLTPSFVATAAELSARVGLADRTAFAVADATALTFDDAVFDAAVMLHVGMNLSDKPAAFAEIARVVRPGGRVVVYDVMRMAEGDLPLPLPWATEAEASFVETPDAYTHALEAAGLRRLALMDRRRLVREVLQSMGKAPPSPNLASWIGPEWSTMFGHLVGAMRLGIVAPIQLVAER